MTFLLRKLYKVWGRNRRMGFAYVDECLGRLKRNAPRIIKIIDGDVEERTFPDLCIIAHYDPKGKIENYVVHYLNELFKAGRETILVSTAPFIDEISLRKAKPFCRSIIIRENKGHDFGSWKAGLEYVADVDPYQSLILGNDSVYGPLRSLGDILSKMDSHEYELWGITDSKEPTYHLQSYFLYFSKSILSSSIFLTYWQNLPYFRFRQSVILRGEIGLSRTFLHAGFRLGALCEYDDLRKKHETTVKEREREWSLGGPSNSTHVLWQLLIRECGCPFLKVGLLRNNPLDVDDVYQWPRVLDEFTDYDLDLVRNHLMRTD